SDETDPRGLGTYQYSRGVLAIYIDTDVTLPVPNSDQTQRFRVKASLVGGALVNPDLQIDGVPDPEEETVGGLAVRSYDGNRAPRKKITLEHAANYDGNLVLRAGSSRVQVFAQPLGGKPLRFDGDN